MSFDLELHHTFDSEGLYKIKVGRSVHLAFFLGFGDGGRPRCSFSSFCCLTCGNREKKSL